MLPRLTDPSDGLYYTVNSSPDWKVNVSGSARFFFFWNKGLLMPPARLISSVVREPARPRGSGHPLPLCQNLEAFHFVLYDEGAHVEVAVHRHGQTAATCSVLLYAVMRRSESVGERAEVGADSVFRDAEAFQGHPLQRLLQLQQVLCKSQNYVTGPTGRERQVQV
jgi:hypothetical protein